MTLLAGVGAGGAREAEERAGFEGTFRILGIGGTGGTGALRAAAGIEFGGAPTGRRIVMDCVGKSGRLRPVDWVAAPRGPEGLSIAPSCGRDQSARLFFPFFFFFRKER